METSYPSINYYRPAKTPYKDLLPSYKFLWTTIKPFLLATHHPILYSMADISKQVSKGQKKWR